MPQHEREKMMAEHRGEVRRYFWRNYILHVLEGGIYMGGSALADGVTVMPRLVEALGGSNWLIALAPSLLTGGAAPGLFLANRLERRLWFKPLLLISGLGQRLPYLAAGLALFLWGRGNPALALAAVALAPVVSGLAGGLTAPAWQEFVAKTVPEERRASLWALRYLIATVMGFGAAAVVKLVLETQPEPEGYGLLYLLLFTSLMVSYALFSQIKETHLPVHRPGSEHTLSSFFRSLPGMIRQDRQLAYYLASRFVGCGFSIMIPFLSIHVLRTLGRPDAYLSVLLAAQMVGGVVGNLAGGWLGDRRGGRLLCLTGHGLLFLICLATPWLSAEPALLGVFVLFGFAVNLNNIGLSTFSLEMAPLEWRVSYQALINFMAIPGLIFPLIGALIRSLTPSFAALSLPAAACIAVAGTLIWKMREPRKA